MILVSFLVAVISIISLADARSGGAPREACDALRPQHVSISPQSDEVPYSIDLSPFADGNGGYQYTPGQTYNLTLSANVGTTFRGFLIQSRLVADDTTRMGEFAVPDGSTGLGIQLSNCDPRSDGVTHVNGNQPRIEFSSITFVWTAPPAGSGAIHFRFAVVQVFDTFWANQSSDIVAEAAAPEPSSPSVTPTTTEATPTVSLTIPTATPQATPVPTSPTPIEEITLEFVRTDTQEPENGGPCNVPLLMIGRLPEDLIVRVRALTIAQYQNLTGNPDAFDDLTPAQSTDFNNSYDQMLIYPQARGVRQEETVEVAIINDDINELNEEFLLFFNVVNDNIPVIIITDPFLNPTRCRIMNDDPIIISFEMNSYTVPEGSSLEDIVLITKGGLTTEVYIEVNITAVSGTAQIGVDFTTPNGRSEFTLDFLTSESEIGVPILIPNNDIVEGNRTFTLQFIATGADKLIKEIISANVTIVDTTPPPPPTPSTTQAPAPSTSQPSSPSSSPPLPNVTVVPTLTTSVQPTNIPNVTTNIPMLVTTSMIVTTSMPVTTSMIVTTSMPVTTSMVVTTSMPVTSSEPQSTSASITTNVPPQSSSLPPLPNPDVTVVPALTTSVQLTNNPIATTNIPMLIITSMVVTSSELPRTNAPIATNVQPECDEKDDKDIDLAIGLTFLITFLLTALCAVIIICLVVIVDRKRRISNSHQYNVH